MYPYVCSGGNTTREPPQRPFGNGGDSRRLLGCCCILRRLGRGTSAVTPSFAAESDEVLMEEEVGGTRNPSAAGRANKDTAPTSRAMNVFSGGMVDLLIAGTPLRRLPSRSLSSLRWHAKRRNELGIYLHGHDGQTRGRLRPAGSVDSCAVACCMDTCVAAIAPKSN